MISKTYELDDQNKKAKRINCDFNLYGVNLNIKNKDNTIDLIKYGRTNHCKSNSNKK